MVRAISGYTPNQLNDVLQSYQSESPAHAAVREFVRGAIQDTGQTASSFSSPLAVATAGTGVAGKIPGAVGTIAKIASTGAAVGFGTQGGREIVEAGTKNTPEAWQERLQGGAMVAGGVAGTAEAGRQVSGTARTALRSALGVSSDLTAAEVAKTTEFFNKAKEKYQSDLLTEKQEYERKVRESNENFKNDQVKAKEANEQALKDYREKAGEIIQKNKALDEAKTSYTNAKSKQQVQGSQVMYRVRKLAEEVRQEASGKYDAVKAKVGDDTTPRQQVAAKLDAARDKWIRGKPEKIAEFDAITRAKPANNPALVLADQTARNQGYANFAEALENPEMAATMKRVLPADIFAEATGQATKPLSWNDLQGSYEEINRKIAGGNLDGDVYQSLVAGREAVADAMQEMANRHGAGKDFVDARKFYRNYMETFRDNNGPSGSGSPIAQALLAKDPLKAIDPFTGKSGDRGVVMLAKYDPELARLAQEVQRTKQATAGTAPKGERKSVPPPPETKPVPKAPNTPLPGVLPDKPTAEIPNPQDINAKQIRSDLKGLKRFSKYDAALLLASPVGMFVHGAIPYELSVLGGRIAIPRILDIPKVVKWMAQPSMDDMMALRKLPPEAQAQVRSQIRQFIAEQRAKNAPLKIDPAVGTWLAAGTAAAGEKTKKLQELRDQQPDSSQQ